MAAPSAPGTPFLTKGEPNSITIKNALVATATKYTAYLSGVTGPTAASHQVKMVSGVPSMTVRDLPPWEHIYVSMTATNAGAEESTESTEASFPGA